LLVLKSNEKQLCEEIGSGNFKLRVLENGSCNTNYSNALSDYTTTTVGDGYSIMKWRR